MMAEYTAMFIKTNQGTQSGRPRYRATEKSQRKKIDISTFMANQTMNGNNKSVPVPVVINGNTKSVTVPVAKTMVVKKPMMGTIDQILQQLPSQNLVSR